MGPHFHHRIYKALCLLAMALVENKIAASMYFWSVCWSIKVASMYFWSVSWSTNCPVYFSFLWSTKKNCPVSETGQKNFGQSLNFFLASLWLFCSPSNRESDQKKFRDWPKIFCPVSETRQFFFGRPKKWEIDRTIGRPRDWPKVHGRHSIVWSIFHFLWSTKKQLSSLWDWTKNFWSVSEFFSVSLWIFSVSLSFFLFTL